MIGLVWLGIIVIVLLGVALVLRQRGQLPTSGRPPKLVGRTLFTLEIGDIVQHLETDWVVEGKLTYNNNGYIWLEYMLQDGDRLCWLSVEEDDQVEVCLLEPVQTIDIPETPPAQLTVDGITYRRTESGTARMTRVGTTLNRQGERCRYFDYASSGDQVLSVEDWNSEREVTVGTRVYPKSLVLLPGDGRRIYDA